MKQRAPALLRHSNEEDLMRLPFTSRHVARRRALTIVTGLLAAASLAAAPSASASGTGHIYWNALLGPGEWGSNGSKYTHVVDHAVWYPGHGTVNVCEQAINANGGALISYKCANTVIYAGSDLNGHYNDLVIGYAGNNSAFTHTIEGDIITNP
jgi:hypothetical protein